MNIREIIHLKENPMIRFKEETVNNKVLTIVSYMIGDSELWKQPGSLETRGNVYDETGNCICACFPKFFNVGEIPENNPNNIKNNIYEILEKRDGSMVTPVLVDGMLFFKTKKTFFSDVSLRAQHFAPINVKMLSAYCLKNKWTPIFEYTDPCHRIVLSYECFPQFTLLACRNQETGEFQSYDELLRLSTMFNDVPVIPRFSLSWEQIIHHIENKEFFEGYVIRLKDGRLVKYKTLWYLAMHRTLTQLRVRDVAEQVIDETIDDLKSILVSQGQCLEPIEKIENQVITQIGDIVCEVNNVVQQCQGMSFKDMAIQQKDHPLFSLIMNTARGKDLDVTDYWKKNYLKTFSLEAVYNENF